MLDARIATVKGDPERAIRDADLHEAATDLDSTR